MCEYVCVNIIARSYTSADRGVLKIDLFLCLLIVFVLVICCSIVLTEILSLVCKDAHVIMFS